MAQQRDGVFTWIHADHLSSVTRITDAAGLEIRRLAYAAFGEEAENQGSGDDPKYTYTGKEQDSSGLYYYGARYYDPALSRFISADTVYDAGPQGLNRYSYALNNPMLYRDPTGHEAEDEETWGIDPNYDAGAASHAQRTENDPRGSWEAPPGAGPYWKYNPDWDKTKDSCSPGYRWHEKDMTIVEVQMLDIPCSQVARFHGVKVYPGYGHIAEWYTTEDGYAACYYRPAKWWEAGTRCVCEEGVPMVALAVAGSVSMSNSSSSQTSTSPKIKFEDLSKAEVDKIKAALKEAGISSDTDILIKGADMPKKFAGMTLGDEGFVVNKNIINNHSELVKTFKHELKHVLDRRELGNPGAYGGTLEEAAKKVE